MHHGLVQVGVERLADRVDALEALLLERAERARRRPARPRPRRGRRRRRRRRAPAAACSTRRRGGARSTCVGLLLDHPLAVVLEVGLDAAQRVEVLVALGGDALEVGDQRLDLGELGVDRLGRAAVGSDGRRRPSAARRRTGVASRRRRRSPAGPPVRAGSGVGLMPARPSSSSTISASTTSSSSAPTAPAPAPPAPAVPAGVLGGGLLVELLGEALAGGHQLLGGRS